MTVQQLTQTITQPNDHNTPGNCLQTAIAALMDLPVEQVPHFVLFTWWDQAMESWARGRHLVAHEVFSAPGATLVLPSQRLVVYGKTVRGTEHAVVYEDGQLVMDPHPSRAGLIEVTGYLFFEEWEHPDLTGSCEVCGVACALPERHILPHRHRCPGWSHDAETSEETR